MKRKQSPHPTRVYAYRVYPKSAKEYIGEQLRLGMRHYNNLIELERERRGLYRMIRSAAYGNLDAIEQEQHALVEKLDAARVSIKAARAKVRKRTRATPGEQTEIKMIGAELKAVRERLKAARGEADALLKAGNDAWKVRMAAKEAALIATGAVKTGKVAPRQKEKLNRDLLWDMLGESAWSEFWKWSKAIEGYASRRKKEIRGASELSPGTYLIVEKSVEAACAKAKKDPGFHSFRGEGRVAVQMRKGTKVSNLYSGASAQLCIAEPQGNPWGKRSTRRHNTETEMTLRLDIVGGEPIVMKANVMLHRPMPRDAEVKWAIVTVRKVASRTYYELQLSLESATFVHVARTTNERVVAVDIGWRALPTGETRVAYYHDANGNDGELLIPAEHRERLAMCDRLRGTREELFNYARAALKAWMGEQKEIQPWLLELTEYMPQWKHPGKLARVSARMRVELLTEPVVEKLWQLWRPARLGEGQDLFASFEDISVWCKGTGLVKKSQNIAVYLEWWRIKNHHLYTWEEHQRRSVFASRREIYRIWSKDMAKRYDVFVLERFDLRSFARNAQPEEDTTKDHQHRIRNDVAPSVMRDCLTHAAGKDCIAKVHTPTSTQQCHLCHYVNDAWEHPEKLVQTCAGCAASWDQDYNASRILLERYYTGEEPTAVAAE